MAIAFLLALELGGFEGARLDVWVWGFIWLGFGCLVLGSNGNCCCVDRQAGEWDFAVPD